MKNKLWLLMASGLMILLSLARVMGGAILITKGKSIELDREIIATEQQVKLVGVGLIIIAVLELICAIGIIKKKRKFWLLSIFVTIMFVIDGAINGAVLFGHPLEMGTLINLTVASLIIGSLILGKRSMFN